MNSRVLLSHRARRLFIWLHLWLGLGLGLWFSLIGVSGSVLAWRVELGAWEINQRFPIAAPAPGATMLTLDAATSKLRAALPDLNPREVSAIAPPQSARDSYKFTLGRDRKKARTVVVDAYSGQILGAIAPRSGTVFAIQNFHQRLIAGMRGYVFNGFLTVLGIPLLLSGLWLWWPRNGPQLRARLSVKRGASLPRKLYDWHNVLGIYLYGVLLVTTVTGALLVKNHLQRDGLPQVMAELRGEQEAPAPRRAGSQRNVEGKEEPTRGDEAAPRGVPNGARLSNDKLLDRARVAAAGAPILRVSLPRKPDEPFIANIPAAAGFSGGRELNLDPYSGALLPPKTPKIEANNVIKGLHLGNFGGVLVKILYTLSGLMPLGLFATGTWLWARKKLEKRARVETLALIRETVEV